MKEKGFAIYRQPYAKGCTVISGGVHAIPSCNVLNGHSGFVMAPFNPSADEPLLIISPDEVEHLQGVDDVAALPEMTEMFRMPDRHGLSGISASDAECRTDYHIDFLNFHAHLLNENFKKLVLSRSILVERKDARSPIALFLRACEYYPRMFISLVYTPQTGIWLTATPEILLAGQNGQWQTVALAGTMAYAEELQWSDKNKQEQRYVATYIIEQLEHFTKNFSEEGPYTARAGHLAHLRSDFHFTLPDDSCVSELLQALHPTPAVCGLPKQDACRFILHNEHHSRSYYSGFMGPLFVEGKTSLFVTLRCMQLFKNAYRLYAGGGLLKDSIEEQEWQETETKLDTMRRIIEIKDKR